jgi:hypothetical protein
MRSLTGAQLRLACPSAHSDDFYETLLQDATFDIRAAVLLRIRVLQDVTLGH